MITGEVVEQLARAIHEHYLREQRSRGVSLNATAAMRPWSDLDEGLKNANRAQARDVDAKLAAIGYTIDSSDPIDYSDGATDLVEFTDAETELLAEREHERWTAERAAAGWTYDVVRDDVAKHHPRLVSWQQLSQAEKQKDRDTLIHLPVVLGSAGLRARRV